MIRKLKPRGEEYGTTTAPFPKKLKSKYNNNIGITEELSFRNEGIPKNYHCKCEYCTKNYLGEIYDIENDTYYSQRGRKKYYSPEAGTHIAPGHFLGYRWAIQNFTKKGDWVFDPTVGTGTAIVEAINHERNGIGIELEFPEVAEANINYQYTQTVNRENPVLGVSKFIHGNAKEIDKLLPRKEVEKDSIQLVINGTPYPTLGSVSSDAPERKNLAKTENGKIKIVNNTTFDYEFKDNFGKKKGDEYWDLVTNMYLDCIPFMKKGAKLVILIKDMMQNKKPYLLHKMIIDDILLNTDELEYHGMYMHKHIPPTLFM